MEQKMNALVKEVFDKYGNELTMVNEQGEAYIKKENLRDFIKGIMEDSGEAEAWSEQDFEDGYKQFDVDGSGQIEKSEMIAFIKRFADL